MDPSRIVRTARARSGQTLRALGTAAGTSHSTLAAYESGAKVPNCATLDRIVSAAGFSLDTSLSRRIDRVGSLSRGDELVAVLDLADAFPARHDRAAKAPVFPRCD